MKLSVLSNSLVVPVLSVIMMILVAGCDSGPSTVARPLGKEALRASILVEKAPSVAMKNSQIPIQVKVKNIGIGKWPSKGLPDGKFTVDLSYHWLDKQKKVVIFEGARTLLPRDLGPDEEVVLNPAVIAPPQPGEYILEFDMVQEAVTWWKNAGSQTATVKMKIE